MLEKIIVSRTRRKIMQILFEDCNKALYLRQIARKIKEEINGVKRELDILTTAKVVIKEQISNRTFFRANKDWLYFQEFLHIFFKNSKTIKLILKNQPILGKINFLVFSDKFITKTPINKTEVYLLIVGTVVLPEIVKLISEIEKDYGREINYTVMTKDEFEFRKKNKDPFLWNFLTEPKVVIIGKEEKLMK
ncbi:MAG: hypothetical protein KatS3mg090_0212 [Patescibacteria group bacterium]|nr:MAG: hypothetical protein KatS3mg090_0212 [Patescibacteria group bacterium]